MNRIRHDFQSSFPNCFLKLLFLILIVNCTAMSAQQKEMMVRISEIEILPQYVSAYQAILQQEASASAQLEPGVIAIFPMYEKSDSTKIRILEMYLDQESYQAHLKTPHFLKYKTTTAAMVKSLQLIDMQTIDPKSMTLLFRKINE